MTTPKPKRNRRPINPAAQWQPQLVIASFDEVQPTVLTIVLDYPVFGPLETIEWTYTNGTVSHTTSGTVLSSSGQSIDLTTITIPAGTWVLKIPAWSPAFRTATGGYIAPASIPFVVS